MKADSLAPAGKIVFHACAVPQLNQHHPVICVRYRRPLGKYRQFHTMSSAFVG